MSACLPAARPLTGRLFCPPFAPAELAPPHPATQPRVPPPSQVRVNWAFQKEQKEETGQAVHVFVGDLSSDVTDAMLHAVRGRAAPPPCPALPLLHAPPPRQPAASAGSPRQACPHPCRPSRVAAGSATRA